MLKILDRISSEKGFQKAYTQHRQKYFNTSNSEIFLLQLFNIFPRTLNSLFYLFAVQWSLLI